MSQWDAQFLKALVADLSVHGVKEFEMTDTTVKISFFEPMPKLVEIPAGPIGAMGGMERGGAPEDDAMLFGGNPPPEFKKPSKAEMRRADPDSASWPEDDD